MAGRISYRKLPGHRRGFIRGSSVWLGPDHLLLVKSMRFREEYKRYYFRDIQAIVVANRPRFHLSTRAALIAFLWLIAAAISYPFHNGAAWSGLAGLLLVITWAYVSAKCSCTCRIYTAVSQDRLPSVYRTWVSRRFLQAVQPHIGGAQGVADQPTGEAVASLDVGPRETRTPATAPGEADTPAARHQRVLSFYLLLGLLFADAAGNWLTLSGALPWVTWVANLLPVLVMAAAIFVLVEAHRKIAGPAHRKLAIGTLVAIGLTFYGSMLAASAKASYQAAITKQAVRVIPNLRVASQIEIGVDLALGLVGLAILFAGRSTDEPASLNPLV